MTGPAEPASRPQGFDDPTRDIRLPPAPGSPPLVVRPEWSSYTARQHPVPADVPSAETAAAPSAHLAAPSTDLAASGADIAAPTADLGKVAPRRPQDALADEPTDQLVQPGKTPRERTLEFAQGDGVPAPGSAPASVVREREGSRRWPWVLIALLPIIVIAGSGIWLFILLSHP